MFYKFADDNKWYSLEKSIENAISNSKIDLIGVMEWYKTNSLEANLASFSLCFLKLKMKEFLMSILVTLKLKLNGSNIITNKNRQKAYL